MVTDFCLFLLPYTPGDYLFIGHHIMTRHAQRQHALGTWPVNPGMCMCPGFRPALARQLVLEYSGRPWALVVTL